MKKAVLLAGLALAAVPARADELERPRYQLAVSGGGSAFRGGMPDSALASAIPFQPDGTEPTAAGALSVRALGKLALEAELALARGRRRDGIRAPNNTFWSAGLAYPWLIVSGGRGAAHVALGGGIVQRAVEDDFQATVERAFEVRETDPQAYAGGGIEWRFTRLLGLRADYRYFRIFPESPKGLGVERESYGTHRVTGGITLSY
jgi:hypothetical protein